MAQNASSQFNLREFGLLLCFVSSQLAVASETSVPRNDRSISLTAPANPSATTHIKYSLEIKGKLSTPSPNGTTDWDLTSRAGFEFDQRRFASGAAGPFAIRAVRRFQVAQASAIVGKDHTSFVSLPAQSRLIHIYGADSSVIQLSPDVRLTRPQLDLLEFPCDPLAVTGLLPGRNLKDSSERWNADSWTVPMLTGMDASVTQSATCTLTELTENEAVISFECAGTGAVTGSSTEIRLQGKMTLDRRELLISSLQATMTEKRSPGTVSPGLDVTATVHWTQVVTNAAQPLPETIPDSSPSERQLLLTVSTPWRVLLLQSRDWHIFHETSELVMLRMLHQGALVAQCNIAPAPLMPAGKHTPDADFRSEVEQALSERGGKIMASRVEPDQNGWRIHHVQARGEVDNKSLVWDYFLCSTRSGEQISLVFSHAEEDDDVLEGVAEEMLKSLTIRPVRPGITSPR